MWNLLCQRYIFRPNFHPVQPKTKSKRNAWRSHRNTIVDNFKHIYIHWHSMLYVSALKTKQLQVQLSCNGVLSVFDTHTGKLVVLSNSAANISSNYTLSPDSPVLAVRCRNYGSKPWIIGSASNGLLTDTRWKCTSLPTHDMKDLSWTAEDFDDSHWAQAVSNVSKRDETPWGKVPDISVEALWISTADEYHSRLFCRRRLSEVSLRQSKSNGMYAVGLNHMSICVRRRRTRNRDKTTKIQIGVEITWDNVD